MVSDHLVLFSLSSMASTNVKMPISNVICYKSSPAQSLVFLFLSVFFSLAVLNRISCALLTTTALFSTLLSNGMTRAKTLTLVMSFPNKICGHPCSRSSPCSWQRSCWYPCRSFVGTFHLCVKYIESPRRWSDDRLAFYTRCSRSARRTIYLYIPGSRRHSSRVYPPCPWYLVFYHRTCRSVQHDIWYGLFH